MDGSEPPADAQEPSVQVLFDSDGRPEALIYGGRRWVSAAESFHWFARRDWWNAGRGAAPGSGDLVSVEYWSIQASAGGSGDPVTFTVHRDAQGSGWVLESVSGRD